MPDLSEGARPRRMITAMEVSSLELELLVPLFLFSLTKIMYVRSLIILIFNVVKLIILFFRFVYIYRLYFTAFGLGTMIYNGLEFGTFFELPLESPCYLILKGINPVLQMVFTFMQMYFIFMNSRVSCLYLILNLPIYLRYSTSFLICVLSYS